MVLFTQALAFARTNRKEVKRFAKFATVGAAGALTHVSLVNILVQIVGWSERMANPVGFSAAVIQNFFLNRRWTYPESRQRHAGRQLLQFAIVSIIGLMINQVVFLTVLHLFEPFWTQVAGPGRLAHALSYNFALAAAIGVVLFWNFTANRLWTYRGLS
ncbi:MAG TPA: GtrA family protein, partial [Caldilineaceae bacterium]|nr:GtrA family protein [Caldilineaceae bacterium]